MSDCQNMPQNCWQWTGDGTGGIPTVCLCDKTENYPIKLLDMLRSVMYVDGYIYIYIYILLCKLTRMPFQITACVLRGGFILVNFVDRWRNPLWKAQFLRSVHRSAKQARESIYRWVVFVMERPSTPTSPSPIPHPNPPKKCCLHRNWTYMSDGSLI